MKNNEVTASVNGILSWLDGLEHLESWEEMHSLESLFDPVRTNSA